MPEIPAKVDLSCDGCRRHFNAAKDLAPARVGTQLLKLCQRCYVTALGPDNKLTFERAQELELS